MSVVVFSLLINYSYLFIPSCVFLNTIYFLFLIAQWSFLPPLRFSTSIFESITHNAFCHFATRWIYISCLVYKNIPCFFPSRAFRNCLNFLFDGFVQLHNNNLISLVFSLSNDSFFLILSDKKKGTNKIWKRDEEAFQLQRSRSIDTCEHHSKLGAKEGGEGK